MTEYNDFMINNFKIFKGEHWFSFKDLNIITGPNNSGKSTFIKAIQLIREGFANSDFPLLELVNSSENLGDFNQVVNHESSAKTFGFGFKIKIKGIPKLFDVVYTFQDGRDEKINCASFLSLEILNTDKKVFIGIYDHYVTDRDEFKSPFDDGDGMSQLVGKIDIKLLHSYMAGIISDDFSILLNHLSLYFKKYWWFEIFEEYSYDYKLSFPVHNKRFNDLINELYQDQYTNLADYELKDTIHFMDDDTTDEKERYERIRRDTDYFNFISKVLAPIFATIDEKLAIFRISSFVQIKPTNYNNNSLFLITSETEYILENANAEKKEDIEYMEFIRKANNIFGFDFFTSVSIIENSGFVVKLFEIYKPTTENGITGKESDNLSIDFSKYSLRVSFEKGRELKNISELGKGSINVIFLILKTAFVIFNQTLKSKYQEVEEIKHGNPEKRVKKIILIEEPEAFLHPDWQSKLADFMVHCIKYDVQFFIETHSEYLIRKLQFLTAKKEIKPEDSVIYYFNHPDEVAKGADQVKEIKILDDGSLSDNFGPGFFDEAMNLKFELLRLKNPTKN